MINRFLFLLDIFSQKYHDFSGFIFTGGGHGHGGYGGYGHGYGKYFFFHMKVLLHINVEQYLYVVHLSGFF